MSQQTSQQRIQHYQEPYDSINVQLFRKHIVPVFQKFYAFGYTAYELNERQLFRRLAGSTPSGFAFCFESSAFNMLALKDCPSSRLVRGVSSDKGSHSWVEVVFPEQVLVIDPCAIYSNPDEPFNVYFVQAEEFYRATGLHIKRVYEHSEFWQYDLSQELYHAFTHSEHDPDYEYLLGAYRPEFLLKDDTRFSLFIKRLAFDVVMRKNFILARIESGTIPPDFQALVTRYMNDRNLNWEGKQPSSLKPIFF